jgi:hypothetical protein
MLTDDFPSLLPRYIEDGLAKKLRTLADDLERIRAGRAPTDGELAGAPSITEWQVMVTAGGLRLTGLVSAHLRLGERLAMTSQVWAADAAGRWIRTLSRFYNLGEADEAYADTGGDYGGSAGGGLRDV